ncbi:hypothetical protein ACJ72_04687 [Emergomyces africanus]|uniref:PNPLA domain-containing protein n=1 Tax=Emergomyces africanus TaxID=1955775 RepID=A0A1B7NW18_9EURO|nr:hypothetical protein ACJ72_04687 [Emergomyces africanus]
MRVVAISISRETSTFVFRNFNRAECDKQCGYKLVRPEEEDDDPFVWQSARVTSAASLIFPPAYIRAVGTFQDGELRENNPAGIARQVSHQIWPTKKRPALVVSIGTGIKDDKTSDQEAPHFRNIFRNGFARRALDAWLYLLDGEVKWKKLLNLLNNDEKPDHIRYNVSLKDLAGKIDNVGDIDSYCNLVILNPGSAKMAAEVTTVLLISSFYFELAEVSKSEEGWFSCRGTIRC